MKPTKKQPKLKKQPIKVQLSKDDLKELLVVVKDFVYESVLAELHRQSKRIFLNCSELDRRITSIEIVENSRREEIHKLKLCCSHKDKLNRIEYYSTSKSFLAAIYRCERCGREDRKNWVHFSRKEKKALRKLGVKV